MAWVTGKWGFGCSLGPTGASGGDSDLVVPVGDFGNRLSGGPLPKSFDQPLDLSWAEGLAILRCLPSTCQRLCNPS